MIRDITIGQYYPADSMIHKLDPRTKLVGTMNAAEEALTSYGFSRGNKSYLINLAHVDGIQDKCAMVKGESLQLSRPRQNAFLQDLTKYWGEN